MGPVSLWGIETRVDRSLSPMLTLAYNLGPPWHIVVMRRSHLWFHRRLGA
jgi:hypothetical protein